MIAERNLGVDPSVARMRLVLKQTGGIRALCEPEVSLSASYAAAVAGLLPDAQRRIHPSSMANRARIDHRGVELEDPSRARRRFARSLQRLAAHHRGPFVIADVLDCYASISLRTVLSSIPGSAPELARSLARFREAGVRGLPIGPPASAVLANLVLASLDDVIVEAGRRHLRWVDDVVVLTDSAREARDILDRLEEEAARLGLHLNDRKTRIVTDRLELQREPSAGDRTPLA